MACAIRKDSLKKEETAFNILLLYDVMPGWN